MHLRLFNTRLSPDHLHQDQITINAFMESVSVKKTATQFVAGNPDYWSILVFYDDASVPPTKSTEKQPTRSETDLDDTGRQILSALRIWRKDKATAINVPDFMICHNATLTEVAYQKPTTLEHLSLIKGIGEQKIAKYGDDMIAIINAF